MTTCCISCPSMCTLTGCAKTKRSCIKHEYIKRISDVDNITLKHGMGQSIRQHVQLMDNPVKRRVLKLVNVELIIKKSLLVGNSWFDLIVLIERVVVECCIDGTTRQCCLRCYDKVLLPSILHLLNHIFGFLHSCLIRIEWQPSPNVIMVDTLWRFKLMVPSF